jgi:hypothetical protein
MVISMRSSWLIGLAMVAMLSNLTAAASGTDQGSREPGLRWLVQQDTHTKSDPRRPTQELNTINDIFVAIHRCFVPPSLDKSRPGMRITVQAAFTRDGEIFGKPRITYESDGATPEQQSAYRMAVAAALARCSPLPFSKSLGGAVAGRIFPFHFVDERNLRGAELNP